MVMSEEEKKNNHKWKTLSSMETERTYFGATAIGDKIYVAGGDNDNDIELSSAEVYDIKLNEWSSLPDMMEERDGCAVTSVNGKVYVVGGRDGSNRDLSSCEMFDPGTNQWTPIPDMKESREDCAACSIGDKIYVMGGGNERRLSSVEVFDTITQEWSYLPDMKSKRYGCVAVSLEDKIYVFGGYDDDSRLSSAEVYDTTTQEWTCLPEMKEKRYNYAATAVGNRIYIIGGEDNDPDCLSSCEAFDTFTNTWLSSSIFPDINEKRYDCQAVSIGSNIYVMGGTNYNGWNESNNTFASIEVLELSMSLLYPIHDNYVTLEGGYYCSPKPLEHLCMDQVCRSLPDLDGEIPPEFPQDIIHAILESLVRHGVPLTLIPLEAFKHYTKLDLKSIHNMMEVGK